MRTTSKILALLLSVCLMMSMTPMAVFAEEQPTDNPGIGASGDVATTTDAATDPVTDPAETEVLAAAEIGTRAVSSLTVDGQSVSLDQDGNGNGSVGGGTWSWDAANNTLTLTNYRGGAIRIDCDFGDTIELVLVGDSFATNAANSGGSEAGLYCAGNLVISGDGSLAATATVDSRSAGIGVYGDLTIEGDSTVVAEGVQHGILSVEGNIVSYGTVTASGGSFGICLDLGSFTIRTGTVTAVGGDYGVYTATETRVSNAALTVGDSAANGNMSGGLIAMNGTVIVNGSVTGDVVLGIASYADVTIEGDINGDLTLYDGSLTLRGEVTGNPDRSSGSGGRLNGKYPDGASMLIFTKKKEESRETEREK